MLAIAGQTVGPNGLNFFEGIHVECLGVTYASKIKYVFFEIQIFSQNKKVFPRAMPGTSAS